jgi:hypothetical protein
MAFLLPFLQFFGTKAGHYAIIALLALAAIFGVYRTGYNSALKSSEIAQLRADKAEADRLRELSIAAQKESRDKADENARKNAELISKSRELEDQLNGEHSASEAERLAYNASPLVKNGTCLAIPSSDYTDDELKRMRVPPARPVTPSPVRRR